MKIGIFDSGIGGLSVLHLAVKQLPREQFIYYADEEHVPYGEKTQEEIIGYVDHIIQFMIDRGASAIVIACNTATSAAIGLMRRSYSIPIVGMEPAVKKAVEACREKHASNIDCKSCGEGRILIAATPVTLRGQKMTELVERVDSAHRVDLLPLPGLVQFAERGEFCSEAVKNYLQKELSAFDLGQYSSFVLGCTHFNYFKDTLREILPNRIRFVDGNEGTVNRLKSLISADTPETETGDHFPHDSIVEYYDSGKRVTSQKELQRLNDYLKRLDSMLFIQ